MLVLKTEPRAFTHSQKTLYLKAVAQFASTWEDLTHKKHSTVVDSSLVFHLSPIPFCSFSCVWRPRILTGPDSGRDLCCWFCSGQLSYLHLLMP